MDWLLDQAAVKEDESSLDLLRGTGLDGGALRRGNTSPRAFAVRLNELIVQDNRAWFGEGEVRLDVLVVHGNVSETNSAEFYHPSTFSFPRIADGDHLPIDQPGLLLFLGRPLYFLDLFLLVSKDKRGSEELSDLLARTSKSISESAKPLISLAASDITSGMVVAGMKAALDIGNLAYRLVQTVTSNTIGLYRTSYLQLADGFGVGRHPETGYINVKDVSFRYEILPADV